MAAFSSPDGGPISFTDQGGHPINLPCGQCIGCRIQRAQGWTLRLTHGNQMRETSSFLALTYEENPLSLIYAHRQRFLKRLRRTRPDLRFCCVGEYGEINWRPHWHTILFGEDFSSDRICRVQKPNKLYESETLTKLWGHGIARIGAVTPETIGYVSRYALKKIVGDKAEAHYTRVTPEGEIIHLTPEMARMSLKPGIGANWYKKYSSDLHNFDSAISRGGFAAKVPRYYMNQLGKTDPYKHDATMYARLLKYGDSIHSTPERLAVREKVVAARLAANTQRKL